MKFINEIDKTKKFINCDFKINENSFIRIFDENISNDEFEWHRDANKRFIKVLYASNDWKLQFDNTLPMIIYQGFECIIEKSVYHKLYKGQGVLVLYVKEIF